LEEAEALFQRYASLKTSNGRLAIALSHRLRSRWDDLLAWLHHLPSEQSILQDQDLAIYYLRSLGETGQVNALLTEVDRFTRRHNRTGNSDLAWLYALAFCGQPDVVRQLLAGSLRHYATSMQQYWSLTAELAAGNGQARGGLIALRSRCDVTVQKAIDWRLSQPLLNLDRVLTDESRRILVGVRAAIAEEENYSNRSVFAQRQAFVTYGLMAMNILIFAVIFIPLIDSAQISPQILTTVVRWFEQGVLIPQRVALGEWWRVISANFLHAGWLHLLANMVGLYFYGTLIESQLGSARFLFAYLFTGIGAMTSVAIVTLYFGDPSQGTVGASGAIMGLLGIFIAILLRGWQREKAAIAGRQLRFALLLVGLQTLSDLLTPQVSLLGHVSGLVLGFLVGWVLKRDRKPRSRLV
jgi:rhomboid protease GluP